MPTNSNAYNSRVTDEALEKRFRDTFRSQGGAQLVDDLYAQGVIVPIVDFTAAATGDVLPEYLQRSLDVSTDTTSVNTAGSATIINNAGFWQITYNYAAYPNANGTQTANFDIVLNDGLTNHVIARTDLVVYQAPSLQEVNENTGNTQIIVFVNSGHAINYSITASATIRANYSYRQVATISGDLIKPQGFTFS